MGFAGRRTRFGHGKQQEYTWEMMGELSEYKRKLKVRTGNIPGRMEITKERERGAGHDHGYTG